MKKYLIGSCGRSPEEVIRKGFIEQLLLRTVRKSKAGQENGEEEGPGHLLRQACHACLDVDFRSLKEIRPIVRRVHCAPRTLNRWKRRQYTWSASFDLPGFSNVTLCKVSMIKSATKRSFKFGLISIFSPYIDSWHFFSIFIKKGTISFMIAKHWTMLSVCDHRDIWMTSIQVCHVWILDRLVSIQWSCYPILTPLCAWGFLFENNGGSDAL